MRDRVRADADSGSVARTSASVTPPRLRRQASWASAIFAARMQVSRQSSGGQGAQAPLADLAALVRRGRTVDRLHELQQGDLGGRPGQPEPAPRAGRRR